MSQMNVDHLRTAFENFLAGRSDFGVGLLDREVEWDASEIRAPDIERVYRGIEGVQ